MRIKTFLLLAGSLGALGTLSTLSAQAAPQTHTLDNGEIRYEFTAELGGRGLGFASSGLPNLLLVGDAVRENPSPEVTAEADFIPYLGHIIWPGPQGDWWRQQSLIPERGEAGAVWPPDPFTVLARNTLAHLDESSAQLVSPVSPVTGLQMTRHYELRGERMLHRVEAVNRRDTPVAWDIWFNTRVRPQARLYVPVRDFSGDLRIAEFEPEYKEATADGEKRARGFFDFARGEKVKAKAFIEPAAGWIAAFDQGQVFVIEFEQQPRAAIHPDQGQVEIYLEYDPAQPEAGVMELEVHAPYRRLAPGESMRAENTWRARPYTGEDNPEGHLRALRELGLEVVL